MLSADLQERAVQGGRDWVRALSADFLHDGRSLEGGFPGTLTEAHIRTLDIFEPELIVGPMRAEIVRVLYDAARAGWSARCRSHQVRGTP